MDLLNQAQFLILGAAVFVLGSFALFIYSILKKEQEFQQKEETTFMKYREILQNAQNQARALLDSTANTSAKMLGESKMTSEHLEVELDRILQTIAQKHIEKLKADTARFEATYNQRLEQFQNDFTLMNKELIETTQSNMTKEVTKAIATVAQRTDRSSSLLDQQIQETLEQTEQEIQEYKKNRLANLDKDIKELIDRTYREVLKQSMPMSVDQELILEGLKKAKGEGGINL